MNLDPLFGKRRSPFSNLVPEPVRRELAEALLCEADPAARAALFDDYQLDHKYGVSRMQFRRFSDRFPCVVEAAPAALPPAIGEADEPLALPAPSVPSPLAGGFRAWLTRAGEVLSQQAESLAADDPEAWERGARAALVARVVAVLAGDRTGPSMHEILTASRILLEQSCGTAGPKQAGRDASGPSKGARRKSEDVEITPEVMHKTVRDLYGIENWSVQPHRGPTEKREDPSASTPGQCPSPSCVGGAPAAATPGTEAEAARSAQTQRVASVKPIGSPAEAAPAPGRDRRPPGVPSAAGP